MRIPAQPPGVPFKEHMLKLKLTTAPCDSGEKISQFASKFQFAYLRTTSSFLGPVENVCMRTGRGLTKAGLNLFSSTFPAVLTCSRYKTMATVFANQADFFVSEPALRLERLPPASTLSSKLVVTTGFVAHSSVEIVVSL